MRCLGFCRCLFSGSRPRCDGEVIKGSLNPRRVSGCFGNDLILFKVNTDLLYLTAGRGSTVQAGYFWAISEESFLLCLDEGGCFIGGVELLVDVPDVGVHRMGADRKFAGDLLV